MSEELLAEISLLKEKLAKAEKERDAAIADLREYCYPVCDYCKYNDDEHLNNGYCKACSVQGKTTRFGWEWRGIQE